MDDLRGFFVRESGRHLFAVRIPDHAVAIADPAGRDLPGAGFYPRWTPGLPEPWREAGPAGGRVRDPPPGPRWVQLYLVVTGDCNLHCRYCAQARGHGGSMSAETIRERVDEFLELSRNPRGVVFYGGEPLLCWPAVRDGILHIRRQAPAIEISLLTNGLLMTPEIADFLAEQGAGVIVSFDGDALSSDRQRVDAAGRGRHRDSVAGFRACRDAGAVVGISCVVGPHNVERIEEVTEYLCRLGPVNIGMNLMHATGRTGYACDPEDGAQAVVRSARVAARHGIEIEQFARVLRAFVHETPRRADCPACGGRLVATPEGWLGVCEGAYPFHRDWFFDGFDGAAGLAEELSAWPCSHPDCRSCAGAGMCGGGCPLDALLAGGSVAGVDRRACALAGAVLDFALERLGDLAADGPGWRVLTVAEKRAVLGGLLIDIPRPLRSTSTYGETSR